ncbi:Aflatoxin biosynthesis regulatory protein [Penicillium lagena]|uniref:Aflatoxin biosynthesis regulatory protein n=1 Tax=Penicillium lagena TaxID=94218 RepID=UPI0025424ABB|nr:Aflatoxin biosynthesis regulatory protein [Penicillium lagena]KAJ5610481.1 Aflatoxin biosynthesis regulatory protein [Penicillium lagena]
MRRVKKSRHGCVRCKSKRVKCGEEKPHCSRCTRLGVRCPGYVQSLRWITKHEQSDQTSSASISNENRTSPASSSNVPQQQQQQPEHIGHVLSLNDDPAQRPSHDTTATHFGLDGPNALCDNLWDLPGNGSLPELTDLCPPSPGPGPSSFSPRRESVYSFGRSGDSPGDLSRFLSLIGPPAPNDEEPSSKYRDFSPSAIVRSYPPAPHPSASRDFMSISCPLNNPSWTLIEYYFKEVAALFSSYDSQMNPFRTTVSRLWGSSLAMCRTMQSMAAATLVNDFPQFGPLGRKMRNEAVDIITREAVMDDKALLALLMLGQTASWHDPTDLGISFFNLLRKQLNTIASSSSHCPGFDFTSKNSGNNYRFFEEALIYWEMLLSFVTDNDTMVFSDNSRSATSMDESLVLQLVPHPWTGIARDTQFTVHEVGRLVRRERKRIRARRFTSQDDISRAQMAIEKARELEARLLDLAHPAEAEIVSPGDDDTPVWHLLTMAEVYRCTGLMQLYRVFPDLLHSRLPSPGPQFPAAVSSTSRDPFFPIDLEGMNMPPGFCSNSPAGATNTNNNSPNTAPSPSLPTQPYLYPPSPRQPSAAQNPTPSFDTEPDPDTSLYENWLTEFAVTTLHRLKTIPLESRTRCLQPFLLVASSSELRLPRTCTPHRTTSPHGQGNTNDNNDYNEETNNDNDNYNDNDDTAGNENQGPAVSMAAIEVSRTRKFILGRLTSFLHVLPPKPINVCLRLVTEVWRRMDAGQESRAFWMDVMMEKGWETTMG